MLDPLTGLGLAGNVIQIIDFSFKLVSEGNQLYHSANGAGDDNVAIEDLTKDLHDLTEGLSQSQKKWLASHPGAKLDADEIRLRNICDRCSEIAVDLNVHLQKLKVAEGARFRRLRSYKQALISVWRKDEVEQIASRLQKYQSEIDTHILVGLRKSAQETDVKNSKRFDELDQQTQDLTAAVLDGNSELGSRLGDHAQVLAQINDNTNQLLLHVRQQSSSPVPPYETVKPSSAALPLHEAAGAGDVLKIRQLLRMQVMDVNARDESGCTPLHLASTGEIAKRLLADKRTEINLEDYVGQSALHYAVLMRRLDVIKALLEAEIDSTMKDDRGNDAAFYARDCPTAVWLLKYGHETEVRASDHLNNTGLIQLVWLGDLEGTEFFLRHGADVNARNAWLESALTEACRHGNVNIVPLLLAAGADIEAAAGGEWTPLLQATRDGRDEVVRLLLNAGANKEAKLNSGHTALAEACARGSFDIARMLIEAGSNVDTPIASGGRTPLLVAAKAGRASSTRWLLGRGANQDAKDCDGWRPAHHAAQGGHSKTLAALLDYKAHVNARVNDVGATPICLAAQLGHYDCVKLLLEARADPNIHGHPGSGFTAIAEASHHGHVEIVKLLLQHRADWKVGSNSGFGAVSVAASCGQNEVIRALAQAGANIEQIGFGWKNPEFSLTPLMRAAQFGHLSTIDVLIELGADVNARGSVGGTAIMFAADKEHSDCVSRLLEQGADVNLQRANGTTALMIAASRGSQAIVQLLVKANANLRLRDWRGCTAWIVAVHSATDKKLRHLLKPTRDEDDVLHRLQETQPPSEIAAYLSELSN